MSSRRSAYAPTGLSCASRQPPTCFSALCEPHWGASRACHGRTWSQDRPHRSFSLVFEFSYFLYSIFYLPSHIVRLLYYFISPPISPLYLHCALEASCQGHDEPGTSAEHHETTEPQPYEFVLGAGVGLGNFLASVIGAEVTVSMHDGSTLTGQVLLVEEAQHAVPVALGSIVCTTI